MALGIGIDIGSVSIKFAVIGGEADIPVLKKISDDRHFFTFENHHSSGTHIVLSNYMRIKGQPLDALDSLLRPIREAVGDGALPITVTGSGAKLAASRYSFQHMNEFSAIIDAVNLLAPATRTVFEMGGETSKYVLLDYNRQSKALSIVDYGTNGDCAAGTGAFMDQQAFRLKYRIEDVGSIVSGAVKSAQIAGRCSVFAKSDMIHAQQRGYAPDEVLKGLCDAVARNFKSAISRSRRVEPPVLFIGGVAMNEGMVRSMRDVFELGDGELVVPDAMCWFGAIGAATNASKTAGAAFGEKTNAAAEDFSRVGRLTTEHVRLLRERVKPYDFQSVDSRIPVYIGIDIGSVSTNLAVIDEKGAVLKDIYVPTKARPIEVVTEGLQEIERDIGRRIIVKGVGTTGSGRELIGILIGADTINDEITAHKTGALHISRTMLGSEVDTIFEIGGQDSKYISIEDGVVVDFTMNDACAAGTGSFLEEQAEDLGVNIKGEFSKLALSSEYPIRLGERCTVFMGRDVNTFMQRGARKPDIIAGLAYSVVHNYLNRVVRGRKIGNVIFFQGGTAYNDSVAAAFSVVTGREIIVPPFNGVMGAIGEALLAKRKMESSGAATTFKGFDLSKVKYELREFTCKGCSNFCTVQEFSVDGEKTYWGDKCSERYRKRRKSTRVPVIDDLCKIRDSLLMRSVGENGRPGPVVGIPFSMYAYDRLPFFNVYLSECGFCTLLSDPTNTTIAHMGVESVVAEPCWPVIVAHGHIKSLFARGAEFVWLPNVINTETEFPEKESYVCVWGSTLPFVARHAPSFHHKRDRLIMPTLHFRDGLDRLKRELYDEVKRFGISRSVSDRAADAAKKAQDEFRAGVLEAGGKALARITGTHEKAIVIVGRGYNVFDRSINLSVASKLAGIYGINVIPMDFLDLQGIGIDQVSPNMYWNYGKRIIQTAVWASDKPNIDLMYVTNFKCGPDSFIKQYIRQALGRPFLVLQFDGHSNDAGMMTRCEAYLDSKGFLEA